jgi:hypothetical protein
MGVWRTALVVMVALAWATPALAQARPCLHSAMESPDEARRREEALQAVRLINSMLTQQRQLGQRPATYPTWEELAQSDRLAFQRGMGGATGELTRKMRWGSSEPLPGWRIHYVAAADSYAFSLTDVTDPCGYTYSTNTTGVITEGQAVTRRGGGIVPVT